MIHAKVSRVVAAIEDPNSLVAGKGFGLLKNAGISPPEVEMIQEIADLRLQLEQTTDESERLTIKSKIRESQLKLDVALDKFKHPR